MGWIAINKQGETLHEATSGRPVQAGEEGELLVIAQEDYLHSVAVDLVNGIIHMDYEELRIDPEIGIVIKNPKTVFHICDETNRVGDLFNTESSKPDDEGYYTNTYTRIQWRPIWFSRTTMAPAGTFVIKCIGAQATLPKEFGGKNVKKVISLFPDNTIGID